MSGSVLNQTTYANDMIFDISALKFSVVIKNYARGTGWKPVQQFDWTLVA